MQRPDKLSDILKQSKPLFAERVNSFAEAYPSIARLAVEVTCSPMGFGRSSTRHYSEKNFSHVCDCSNPQCYGGGVQIGWIIHDMADKRQTNLDTTEICRGYEGSPKGKKRYRSCGHAFRIKAEIEYKPESGTSTE